MKSKIYPLMKQKKKEKIKKNKLELIVASVCIGNKHMGTTASTTQPSGWKRVWTAICHRIKIQS